MLSGCASQPAVMNFPDVPAELKEPAPVLTPLGKDQHKLSDLIQNANDNYSEYYVLKNKYEAWQTWYEKQQKIYSGVIQKTKSN